MRGDIRHQERKGYLHQAMRGDIRHQERKGYLHQAMRGALYFLFRKPISMHMISIAKDIVPQSPWHYHHNMSNLYQDHGAGSYIYMLPPGNSLCLSLSRYYCSDFLLPPDIFTLTFPVPTLLMLPRAYVVNI